MTEKVKMTKTKQVHILLSTFEKLFYTTHGYKTRINRYSAKWGMIDVIDSVGYDKARELLEYYFTIKNSTHTLEFFYKNFVLMEKNMEAAERDRQRRAIIMEQTKKRIEEG
jgi:hypothetical protein